jgi:Ser/Thr protein kinase RdoA (MazF antagonist)
MNAAAFDLLTPDLILNELESAYRLSLDGRLQPYPSYVNRVYGIRTDEGREYVAKFYRPGRWSVDAIAEEQEFVLDCLEADVPVVAPLPDPDGYRLQIIELDSGDEPIEFAFALYDKRGGRGFDAETGDEWYRLGSLAGRVHAAAGARPAEHRMVCSPVESTRRFVTELREAAVVHPEIEEEFFTLVEDGIGAIAPLFEGVPMHRIHGDFHRGNVLDRGEEGLLLIDFDDMMVGPAVQDLWLLLPDHAWAAQREIAEIVEGYEQFADFPRSSLRLIEPLRFMRIIYFLAWSALQRGDNRFLASNEGWGTRAFWIREVEDIRAQLDAVAEDTMR